MSNGPEKVRALLADEALMERLAAIEHERWSHWQRYLHSKSERTDDGSLVIPPALVEQWTTQMNTPYDRLSAKEKESDREQVRKFLPEIATFLSDGFDSESVRRPGA